MKKNKNAASSRKEKKTENAKEVPLKGEDLWRPLYPFQSHYLRIGGYSMHYIDEGPHSERNFAGKNSGSSSQSGSLPVLLFVHGNPTWSFYWRKLILAFREKYRVIAIDHIGCGLSEKPPEKEYPYTLERRIADLTAFIKKLNLQNITLVAHDWGGAIGLGTAEKNEKRFSRFVLMNTGAFLSDACPLRIRICRIPLLNRLLLQGLNAFSLAALRMATANPLHLDKGTRAGLIAPYSSWANRVAVYNFVQDIPLSEKHRSYQRLKEIQQDLVLFQEKPISLIWGMQDWCFTPEFLKKFLQFFPAAEIHRIEKAGHYVVEDAPEEIIAIMNEFLQ
ncbi:MAG: alpha/beta fold hydrolase [Planctomycetia bacterium]|nr:alpha/beta fold hydrolase [Planctomycetia bacterium]